MLNINIGLKRYSVLIWIFFICSITVYVRLKQSQNEVQSTEGRFWVLTDSHVDILYRPDGDPATRCRNVSLNNMTKIIRKFGHFDCDAPMDLLISAFSAARKFDSDADFIIWLGDSTAHRSPDKNSIINVTMNFTQEIRKYFPTTLIIPVLGNHDVLFTSNRSTRFSEFYNETKYDLLLNDTNARETFLQGGYYSIRYQTLKENKQINLRFIALNTAMFQPQYSDHFDPSESIQQINWFNKTMSDAYNLNDRILLLAHVPFGINENLLYRFYDIKYEQKLLSIINLYSSNIIMCLTGHRHQDTFRIYSSSNTVMGILSHPSISPIGYLSQPSIRKYFYNKKSLILTDYEQYSLNIIEAERTKKDQWIFSYRFSSWYHQTKDLTSKNLFQLISLIRRKSFYLKRFLIAKHYSDKSVLTNHKIIQTICALTLFNFDEFILCTRLLENKNIRYDNLIVNYSLKINAFRYEQLIEYRIIYKRVAIILLIIILVILWISYQIYWKVFFNTNNEKK